MFFYFALSLSLSPSFDRSVLLQYIGRFSSCLKSNEHKGFSASWVRCIQNIYICHMGLKFQRQNDQLCLFISYFIFGGCNAIMNTMKLKFQFNIWFCLFHYFYIFFFVFLSQREVNIYYLPGKKTIHSYTYTAIVSVLQTRFVRGSIHFVANDCCFVVWCFRMSDFTWRTIKKTFNKSRSKGSSN